MSESTEGQYSSNESEVFPMNYSVALKQFLDDEELLREMIGDFLEDFRQKSDLLSSAIEAGDHRVVAINAHQMKSGAGFMQAETLAALALDLESSGENNDLEQSREIFVKLQAEFNRFVSFVNSKHADLDK